MSYLPWFSRTDVRHLWIPTKLIGRGAGWAHLLPLGAGSRGGSFSCRSQSAQPGWLQHALLLESRFQALQVFRPSGIFAVCGCCWDLLCSSPYWRNNERLKCHVLTAPRPSHHFKLPEAGVGLL